MTNILLLHQNRFEGRLPDVFDQLPALTLVKVEYNQFTGPIPTSLSSCVNLEELILSHNQFGGGIPDEFVDLTALKEVSIAFSPRYTSSDISSDAVLSLQISFEKNLLSGDMPSGLCDAVDTGRLIFLGADCEAVSCSCCHNCHQ